MKMYEKIENGETLKFEDGSIFRFNDEFKASKASGSCNVYDKDGNYVDEMYVLKGNIICSTGASNIEMRKHLNELEDMFSIINSQN